jgi:DNA-binding transcriptional LysR family regulator
MSDPDLRDLAAFAAVARTRNFRRAAAEQQVSASALSQRLRDLEERLGVRLLHRTTRSVALTEAGEMLLERIGPALRDVGAALDQIRGLRAVPSGRLRINAPAPAVELVLAPMVAPFLAAYPLIDLEVVAQTRLIDIVAEGFDAGIRYGEHLAQDMVAVPLGPPQHYAAVATPDYWARHGTPLQPHDLLAHRCIATRYESGVIPDWEFEKAGRTVRITPRGPLRVNSIALALRAARDGLGVLLIFRDYVEDDLAAGRLVGVLTDWCEPFPGPFLYYPSRRQPPPALRAFLDFAAAWRRRESR